MMTDNEVSLETEKETQNGSVLVFVLHGYERNVIHEKNSGIKILIVTIVTGIGSASVTDSKPKREMLPQRRLFYH